MLKRLFLILLPLAILPNCGGPIDDAGPPVRVILPEGGAPLNEIFSFEINPQGLTLTGVDADMPAHGHGINTTPEFERLENGNYRIDGMKLHMPGAWELYFDLQDESGASTRIVYPLELDFQ